MKKLILVGAAVLGIALNAASSSIVHAGKASATGEFKGASDHITTGGVSIIKTAGGGAVVILDTNFSLDGAPDPRVGFGKDGKYANTSDLGALTKKEGLQVFVVPSSVNVDDFNEVYIWCRKFAVPLGIASIK